MRKKMRSRCLAALLSLTLAAGLMPAALAEGEEESQPPEIAVTEVRLDKSEVSLKKGETLKLEAEVLPEDATNKTVHWTSSREAVATVEDGLVTAVSPGEADIFVTTDGGLYATCAVTVEEPVSGVVLNKDSLSLKVGGTETLTATVSPENATNKRIKWTSTKENVATVKDGQVTAVGVGTTTIAAITDDDGKTATCTVTVEADTAPAISLSSSAINVSIGGTASQPMSPRRVRPLPG